MADFKYYNDEKLMIIKKTGVNISQSTMRALKISRGMMAWFRSIEEVGFLVKANDEIGFMYMLTEFHTGQPEGSHGYQVASTHGSRTSDDVFGFLKEVSSQLAPRIRPSKIYIGANSAANSEHELCLFFPYGMDTKDISNMIELARETKKEMAWNKWQSFVDLIEG